MHIMPCRCNVFGCRGNYPGEPYMKTVSFPKDPNERKKWIDAMPIMNDLACHSFTCVRVILHV